MSDIGPAASFDALPRIIAPAPSASFEGLLGDRAVFVRDLLKYGLCSALALSLDWGTLVGLVAGGVTPLAASAIGFTLGMGLTYVLSITFVFVDRRQRSRLKEALAFVAIGFAGLGVNQLMLWALIQKVGLMPGVAKAPTAGVVFLFNFVLRRTLAFSKSRP